MMSLSNNDNDNFEPIAVNSLENFDQEHSKRTHQTKPDLDRFKALFEKSEFEDQEADEFNALYDVSKLKKEKEDSIFKLLFDVKEPSDNSDESEEQKTSDNFGKGSDGLDDSAVSVESEPETPEETPEEKGYRVGFEKGLEAGKEQGYEEGFKKSEEEGLKQGEQQGIELGKEQGIEEGIKLGEEKGESRVREDSKKIIESLENSLVAADKTLDLLVEKYETGIISLMEQIVKKIIMAHMQIDDEVVKPMILDALKTLVQAEEVVLIVSEDDYEYIEMIKDEFFETIDSLTSVSVKSDPTIKKGGCKIETNTATISSDVESRLETIFEAIKTAGAL